MPHNLAQLFGQVAVAVSERECIVFGPRRLQYRDVLDQARRFGRLLREHGLGARRERPALRPWESGQSHVALLLLNGNEYLEATFGCHAARCVPFNVNYRYTAAELANLFNDAGPEAIVFHHRFAATLVEALPLLRRRPLLVQVAWVASHARGTVFEMTYRRWAKRMGRKRALVGVGYKVLKVIYEVLRGQTVYQERLRPDQAA